MCDSIGYSWYISYVPVGIFVYSLAPSPHLSLLLANNTSTKSCCWRSQCTWSFEKMMRRMFTELEWGACLVDDILLYIFNEECHVTWLRAVLKRSSFLVLLKTKGNTPITIPDSDFFAHHDKHGIICKVWIDSHQQKDAGTQEHHWFTKSIVCGKPPGKIMDIRMKLLTLPGITDRVKGGYMICERRGTTWCHKTCVIMILVN